MTITGNALGQKGRVYIGSERCDYSTWTPEEIVCVLPANSDGEHAVRVEVTHTVRGGTETLVGSWYASGAFSVTYTFRVTGVSTTAGSLLGGTEVVISGQGFPCDNVAVSMGPDYICHVSSCTPTNIACR